MNKFLFIFAALFLSVSAANAFINDDFAARTLTGHSLMYPDTNTVYNYESFDKVPVHLQILENITTKNNGVYEGQELKFKVKQDVRYHKRRVIPKNTIVTARIETYVTRGMNGIPATLIIDNFNIPDIEPDSIKGPFIKKGVSLTLLVLPVKWALTPIPGVGSLTNFIIGCNANLTDKDNIVIYYYPNRNKSVVQ